jgi:CHAD domain-containing protein
VAKAKLSQTAKRKNIPAPQTAMDLVRNCCAESLAGLKKYRAASLRLEAEPIHQMRVATRKLRAVLRIFHDLMDKQWADELSAELRWVAHLLGPVRDLDILRERLKNAARPQDRQTLRPIQRLLGERHHDAQAAMKEGLKSERYSELVERLRIGSLSPEMTLEAGEPPSEIMLPMILNAWKKLARTANKLQPEDAPVKYHHVRKMAKRVRYATELLMMNLAVSDRENAEQFIKCLKKLQDTLGEHQDAVVAAKTVSIILDAKAQTASTTNAAKRLITSQEKAAKSARRKLSKVWKAVNDSKNQEWMK